MRRLILITFVLQVACRLHGQVAPVFAYNMTEPAPGLAKSMDIIHNVFKAPVDKANREHYIQIEKLINEDFGKMIPIQRSHYLKNNLPKPVTYVIIPKIKLASRVNGRQLVDVSIAVLDRENQKDVAPEYFSATIDIDDLQAWTQVIKDELSYFYRQKKFKQQWVIVEVETEELQTTKKAKLANRLRIMIGQFLRNELKITFVDCFSQSTIDQFEFEKRLHHACGLVNLPSSYVTIQVTLSNEDDPVGSIDNAFDWNSERGLDRTLVNQYKTHILVPLKIRLNKHSS